MKSLFNLPLLTEVNPLPFILIGSGVLIVIVVVIVLIFLLKGKKKKTSFNGDAWTNALGSKENIKEVTAIGSRLSVSLLDKEKIDREKLKELGVSSVLVMSNKVTLVIENQAEQIANSIKNNL